MILSNTCAAQVSVCLHEPGPMKRGEYRVSKSRSEWKRHFPDHLSIFSKSEKSYVNKNKLFLTNGWVGSQFVIFIMAGRHSRPIRLLGENYHLYNYMYIMTSRRSVLAQALLHIPPPRLLPLSFVGKHAEIRT